MRSVVRVLLVGGPAMLGLLVAVVAGATLAGPDAVARVVGSPLWYLPGLLALVAGPFGVALGGLGTGRARLQLAAHLGLALGVGGIVAGAALNPEGYLFAEAGGAPAEAFITRDLERVELLGAPVRLDSMRDVAARGFRGAPVLWLSVAGRAARVAWNHPGRAGGRELLFSRVVDPGFPLEYEVRVNGAEYLLLHNQRVRVPVGMLAGRGFDFDARRLELACGTEAAWLGEGDSAELGGAKLVMGPIRFAAAAGAILLVKRPWPRWLVVLGFALALAGLLPALRRRRP